MSIESSKGFPRTVGGKVRFPRCQDVIESLLMYWGGNEIEFGWGRGKYEIKNDLCLKAEVIFIIQCILLYKSLFHCFQSTFCHFVFRIDS